MTATVIDARRWMQGASGPLRGVLLSLVMERAGHGGQLASRLQRRLGETWRVDPTDVYRLLRGLERAGLVVGVREAGEEHVVYHATDQTPLALGLWLETLFCRESCRDALLAKLAAAREQDLPQLRQALGAREQECLETVRLMPSPVIWERAPWQHIRFVLTQSYHEKRLHAEIKWVRQVRETIDEWEHAQRGSR